MLKRFLLQRPRQDVELLQLKKLAEAKIQIEFSRFCGTFCSATEVNNSSHEAWWLAMVTATASD